MDLTEKDIEARVVKYFVEFDQLVQDNGFEEFLGVPVREEDKDIEKKESRCKLLMESLAPPILKDEIKRAVSIQHKAAKNDDVALYNLILERAKQQQHYFLLQTEDRGNIKQKEKYRDHNTNTSNITNNNIKNGKKKAFKTSNSGGGEKSKNRMLGMQRESLAIRLSSSNGTTKTGSL
jgi:hypothetical protein